MQPLIRLLLPALIPSWRFFRAIEPSPRVEWRPTLPENAPWRDYAPRPEKLRLQDMIRQLFWNPQRNTDLYLVSLSERVIANESAFAAKELKHRVCTGLAGRCDRAEIRLVFLFRVGGRVEKAELWRSRPLLVGESS